jgi:hypothetical protein
MALKLKVITFTAEQGNRGAGPKQMFVIGGMTVISYFHVRQL